jgi:hypothetical protein
MIDSIPLEANGPAYQHREVREGTPLDYVAEKLRSSLEALHGVHARADAEAAPQALLAFHYAVVAYLALKNMLAASNAPLFAERLARMPSNEFERWLDVVDRGGSVTGLAL